MKLIEGISYIVQDKNISGYNQILKIRVEEVTECSVFIRFLDSDGKTRMLKEHFENRYKILEKLPCDGRLYEFYQNDTGRMVIKTERPSEMKELKSVLIEISEIL